MIVMSCNIRYSRAEDGPNNWPLRRDLALRVILSRRPDVVCFQEMTAEQHRFLCAGMAGFASVRCADEPAGDEPVNAIFYRSGLLEPVSVGAYWLSRTPHVPGTKSWASACVRMVTWARFRRGEAGSELRIINTHLDHVSQRARVRQASMIARDCAAYPPEYPQVLTGDFNCDHRNPAVRGLMASGFRDTYQLVHGTADPFPTFHAFQGRDFASPDGKIDWVMVRGRLEVSAAEVVTNNEAGRYPSDHFFVTADVG